MTEAQSNEALKLIFKKISIKVHDMYNELEDKYSRSQLNETEARLHKGLLVIIEELEK